MFPLDYYCYYLTEVKVEKYYKMEDFEFDDDAVLADAQEVANNIQAPRARADSTGMPPTANGLPEDSISKEPTRASNEVYDTCFEDRHYPYALNRQTILDYFSRSPFYDKNSNNEIVREQNKTIESMKYMRGLEFVSYPSKHEPRLFVVVKQIRSSEHAAVRKAVYYVLDRVVYQAPNVRQVCLRRIRSVSENLMDVFDFFSQYRGFNCVEGRFWNFPSDSTGVWKQSAESARLKLNDERQNFKRTRRVNTAIQEAIKSMEDSQQQDNAENKN